MKETGRHKDAFEFYYNSGGERTAQKVATEFGVTRRSIEEWKAKFNWNNRVECRDITVMEAVEKQMSKSIIQEKLEYHKSISQNISILRAIVGTIIQKIKDKDAKLMINNLADYNAILGSFERLIRLDLFLLGEPDKLLLKFKGDISVRQQDAVEKLVKDLTDEQLNDYITTLAEGKDIQDAGGAEEKAD